MTQSKIIVPSKSPQIAIAGEYSLIKRKVGNSGIPRTDDPIVQYIPAFSNKITDVGLNLAYTSEMFTRMYLGTGTTPAANNDTKMGNWAVTSPNLINMVTNRITSSPYWTSLSATARFTPGTATGTFTEVGIGYNVVTTGSANNYLWSRELIVDGTGTPIAITVLADEYLDVIYTLRQYPPLTDTTGTFLIDTNSYNYTARPIGVLQSYWDFSKFGVGVTYLYPVRFFKGATGLSAITADGNINTLPGSTTWQDGDFSAATTDAYVDNSYRRTSTYTVTPAVGNIGGIDAMIISTAPSGPKMWNRWQFLITPTIPKDNTRGLILRFATSIVRYAP